MFLWGCGFVIVLWKNPFLRKLTNWGSQMEFRVCLVTVELS